MKKTALRLAAMLAAFLMLFVSFTVPSFAEEKGACFSIKKETALIEASGMSGAEWEQKVLEAKQSGLLDPLDEEALKKADPGISFSKNDGRIIMISSPSGIAGVRDAMDAYRYVYRLLPVLGGAEDAVLRLWSVLEMNGMKVYAFQQTFDGLTVLGSTVKLAADKGGRLTAVFSSLSPSLPESGTGHEISAAEAEECVRGILLSAGHDDSVMPEYTRRAVIPCEDAESTEILPDRLVWTVYSLNPGFAPGRADLPYLAHFVGTDGEYLHSCTATVPGDRLVRAGYSSAYAFEFMEAAEWSGTVTDAKGAQHALTVPVMKDTRTGIWYLADPERQIAVGEFAKLAYGDEEVSLLSGSENGPWDDEDLLTYANLIRVWDYYAAMGWRGPDGEGTPVLLLRDLCDEDGNAVYNAAYMGLYMGWQCFAYGGDQFIGQALDVMAHEFTHCVTASAMGTNLYRDDMGAINEAMSDIMGNVCESALEENTDTDWLVGENSGKAFRSMLHPHEFGQPEYVWDLYYVPAAATPNGLNDRGGVHADSSILNRIAARLYLQEGMSLAGIRDLFMTCAFVMTPETDHPAMAGILRWALETSGQSGYAGTLERLIAESRISSTSVPEALAGNRVLAEMTLPDTEAFREGSWILTAVQFDAAEAGEILKAMKNAVEMLFAPDVSGDALLEQLALLSEKMHLDTVDVTGDPEKELLEALSKVADDLVKTHITWENADTGRISLILRRQPTLYLLFGAANDESERVGTAVYLHDQWFDINRLLPGEGEEWDDEYLGLFLGKLLAQVLDYAVPDGENGMPASPTAKGLEAIVLTAPSGDTEDAC